MAVAEQENPLVEGLERLPIHPTTMVIFGGTGDLAHRKLLPAIYNLAHEGALPERFNLIAVSRSDIPHDDYRAMARESIEKYSRRKPDPQVLDKLLEQVRYVPGTFDDDSVYGRLDEQLKEFDKEAGIEFNRLFYLSTSPAFFPVIVGKLGEHGLNRHAEAEVRVVIEKPFGTRLERGARAEPPGAVGARRVAGLPDRPLPGQGNRPEHAGVPLRERPVRADLEPQLHRLRPDHRCGGPGHRQPRRVLRHRGRAARPGREPHDAAAHAAVHGAAGHLHRRRRARREGQGAARDQAGRAAHAPCAPATRRGWPRARRCPGYVEEEGVPRRLADRDLRGAAARGRQLALGRRSRSTCAPASAWRARSRRSRSR